MREIWFSHNIQDDTIIFQNYQKLLIILILKETSYAIGVHIGVRYDAFKGTHPKRVGVNMTQYNFSKSIILTGLTLQEKVFVTIFYKFIVLT